MSGETAFKEMTERAIHVRKQKAIKDLIAEAERFCQRVDDGLIRSQRTYSNFKRILKDINV